MSIDDGTPLYPKGHDVPKALQQSLIDFGAIHGCLNCSRFSELDGCLLVSPPRMPPPRVIVYGCEKWEFCPF